ncbi:glycosyltransferase family A protein [Aurantimicrobium sp. INA4]|uniref:glycosyltransferase family 2 protein n=1 Tax=Aurantimicrobium sp. INA4 TaxID=2986279 RepID=UPI00248F5793|nr:glycosyltransferase family A protein [Aurantimicrobium sp. INA4]
MRNIAFDPSQPLFQEFLSGMTAHFPEPVESSLDPIFEVKNKSAVTGDKPFLTILMRTQGRRLNAFSDVLTSLYGQTSQDFAVLLLEHDVTDEIHQQLEEVINQFPEDFTERIRQVRVEGGGRARPLNVGIELANSSYIAALDDDDIVFAHWVEEFKKGALLAPGRMIRTICAVQKVEIEEWSDQSFGFRAISWPEIPYAIEYSQLDHLRVNHSPFMSVAFPTAFFSVLGNKFDEELDVCEDWDMILRVGSICGVHQQNALTAIYRNWVGVETSYTEHSETQWRESEQRVIEKLNLAPYVFQTGTIDELRKLAILHHEISAEGSYGFMFKDGVLRRPFRVFIRLISPFIRIAVRARNLLRRVKAKLM